jgi:hypothetical protein
MVSEPDFDASRRLALIRGAGIIKSSLGFPKII